MSEYSSDRPIVRAARAGRRGIASVWGNLIQLAFRAVRLWDRFAGGKTSHGAPICLVTHDAHKHGAQLLLLELARIFATRFGCRLHIVSLGPGELLNQFRRYGNVHILAFGDSQEAQVLAKALADSGVRSALCNTTASGQFLETLSRENIRCVALVHELPEIIRTKNLMPSAAALARHTSTAIFPSETVRDAFPVPVSAPTLIRPQGLAFRRRSTEAERRRFRSALASQQGVANDAKIVLGVGYGDRRKGIDLFVRAGQATIRDVPMAHFIWVGDIAPECRADIDTLLGDPAHRSNFTFIPFSNEIERYYEIADAFALTSREDPFPTVLLEAMRVGAPCVAFAGAGGFEQLFADAPGALVAPIEDTDAFARTLVNMLAPSAPERAKLTVKSAAVTRAFNMQSYAFDLATLLDVAPPRVSVIVPSYNYARYLSRRLETILAQTIPIYELIVTDDCSDDESVAVARQHLQSAEVEYRIVENTTKSGDVFEQWRRGVELARGELVWIAEADDLSDTRFVEVVSRALADSAVVLSYAQSAQVDESGRTLDRDYLTYVSDVDPERWRSDFVSDGLNEIRDGLSIKNTIPNVSACLFRRTVLASVLERHIDEICAFRTAGDWLAYVRVAALGKVAFHHGALNQHRRHAKSATASLVSAADHVREIRAIQALVAREFAVPAEKKRRAEDYAVQLETQFGLRPRAG